MHAATLMYEIKKIDKNANFHYFGGDLMQAQGGTLLKHYREMAFMGILPVISNLRTIKKNFNFCEKQLLDFDPHVLILIDYPGFNLRMARFAKKHNIAVSYYISPKVWAWKTKRVYKIKAYVDKLYTIFPFETAFFEQYNYKVNYVGNPVYDMLKTEIKTIPDKEDFVKKQGLSGKDIIALLPGSRNHEIESLLPIMEKIGHFFKNYEFIISGAPGKTKDYYQNILKTDMKIVFNNTYQLLKNSKAAIVASGTATLETALLKTPQVVIYKMGLGWFLELFRKQILKTKYFSLVNLVAEKEVVKELFQSEVTTENIKNELENILHNKTYRSKIMIGYNEIEEKLASEGAAAKTANAIVKSIKINKL
jgi:lipid-A-disaccharide synthase